MGAATWNPAAPWDPAAPWLAYVGPETASSTQHADVLVDGFEVGDWVYEVRTFDGEFWSPWSKASTRYTVTPEVAPTPGRAVAAAPAPPHSNGVVLEVDPCAARAAIVAPWSERDVVVGAASSEEIHWVHIPQGYVEFQARTQDQDGWSRWSSEVAAFFTPPTINVGAAEATARIEGVSTAPSVQVGEIRAVAAGPPFEYSNGVVVVDRPHGPATAAMRLPWISLPEVASSTQSGEVRQYTWPVGHYEYQVRTHDGEAWSPWSFEVTRLEIPSDVSVEAARAVAAAPSFAYSNAVKVEVPAPRAGGAGVVPWTSLTETASSSTFADVAAGPVVGTVAYQVRTSDADGWGRWSTEQARVTLTSRSNTFYFNGTSWVIAARNVLTGDARWVPAQSARL